MTDIDRLSRKVPHLCKVAPNTHLYHMEDVHRAGGIMAILGELNRAGLLHTGPPDRRRTTSARDNMVRSSARRAGRRGTSPRQSRWR